MNLSLDLDKIAQQTTNPPSVKNSNPPAQITSESDKNQESGRQTVANGEMTANEMKKYILDTNLIINKRPSDGKK